MRYESERDVSMRLGNSLVMWEKRPVIVTNVENVNTVIVQDIITDRSSRVRLEALDLNPESVKLGYVLTDNDKVFFSMRKPTRRFKQGLTPENFYAFNAMEKPSAKAKAGRMENLSPFNKGVAKTIMGAFPDIGEAFQKVRGGHCSIMPFSREWAVAEKDEELSLMYRGSVVGYVGDSSVKLIPEYFYLKEALELCLK